MQQYPNYFPTMAPAYLGNYGQPMQQFSNPYMERLAQYQQSLQSQSQPGIISGKVVESIDIVKATDIPMNGEMFYFPKADGTEVYAKRWLPNGTTEVVTYKPVLEAQNTQAIISPNVAENLNLGHFKGFTEEIMKRFDDIEGRLEALDSLAIKTSTKTSQKNLSKEE